MKRWLLNILAAASFLLFLATAGLWVRSYYRGDMFTWGRTTADSVRACGIVSDRSGLSVVTLRLSLRGPDASQAHSIVNYPVNYAMLNGASWRPGFGTSRQAHSFWEKLGFYLADGKFVRPLTPRTSEERASFYLSIPHWFACLLTLLLPTAKFVAWRKRLRRLRRVGHCRYCDYDLRAHKPGDRCPECGEVFSPVAARDK